MLTYYSFMYLYKKQRRLNKRQNLKKKSFIDYLIIIINEPQNYNHRI